MIYDTIIVGGGPAGLTAAIYASRARLKTLLIESLTVPGQAVMTSEIENYPGFPEALRGFDFVERFRKQAGNFGTEFKIADVKGILRDNAEGKNVWSVDIGTERIASFSLIIATGARPKLLNIPGEKRLRGKGVSYCAVCDAALFKDRKVVVVGGGNTAIEEAIFLTRFAREVNVIHRRDRLRATQILQERACANRKIVFSWNSVISEISGEKKVESVTIKNVKTGKETILPCDGVFMFVGYVPNTEFLRNVVENDDNGYIVTDENMKTSKEGMFACGDVRKKLLRQIVTACGDGAVAAYAARLYVDELKGIAYK